MKNILRRLKHGAVNPDNDQSYFAFASSWADDMYLNLLASRNQWRVAALLIMLIFCILLLGFVFLLPLQHVEPLLIHHYEDGRIFVDQPSDQAVSPNHLQVQSDIIRYVVNRESYDPVAWRHQYDLVKLLSSSKVASVYEKIQLQDKNNSPALTLKDNAYLSCHVESILFLSGHKKKSSPLAQVNFTVSKHWVSSDRVKTTPYVVLISWRYTKTSHDPERQWLNWDGFSVIDYQKQQRSLK
jgi:type IV secretion system protein VirB8